MFGVASTSVLVLVYNMFCVAGLFTKTKTDRGAEYVI